MILILALAITAAVGALALTLHAIRRLAELILRDPR